MDRDIVFLVAMMGMTFAGMAHASIPDQVQIGILLPHTGSLDSSGVVMQAAVDIAVADFNAYLEGNDIRWRLVAVSEDTGSDPDQTLEKVRGLHDMGIDIVIGPAGSRQLEGMMDYANENNMFVISPGSTAPSLAIQNDAIYRTVPDDLAHGRAFGAIMWHDDIQVIVPMWRGDVYGDDLINVTVADFEERGGVAYQGVRYDPGTVEFDGHVAELAAVIEDVSATHGAEHTAVLVVAFDEMVDLLLAASEVDILRDVRWVSNESVIQSDAKTDTKVLEFTADVRMVIIQQLFNLTERADPVRDVLAKQFAAAPSMFAYPSYDAVWLAGLSVLEAGDTDPAALHGVIRDVAMSGVNGTLASTVLNEAGDLERSQVNFEALAPIGGEWILGHTYYGFTDTVVSECQVDVMITIQNGFDVMSDSLTYLCGGDGTGSGQVLAGIGR